MRDTRGVDLVWRLTQDPSLHARWDLRFTHITPSGLATDRDPQRFRYEVRLPGRFGRRPALRGWGVSVGHRRDDEGHGTSALRFAPDDGRSPLGPGSGYWRYVPTDRGLRFLTGYDYTPGWGRFGRALDAPLVRPVVGWATAWSFDRLRLWVERGIDPARSRDAALAVVLARVGALAAGSALVRSGSSAGAAGATPGLRGPRATRASLLGAGAALIAAAALVPAPSTVPSARRTLRRPPDPGAARAPRSLATLDEPRSAASAAPGRPPTGAPS